MNTSTERNRLVTIAVIDTNGLLRGQKISSRNLPAVMQGGMGMAPAQLALDPTDVILEMPGVTDDSADFHDSPLKVDQSSHRQMPWESPSDSTLYLAEFTGDAANFCPRSLLRKVLMRASEMGFVPKYGLEQEFTLFNETPSSLAEKGYDNLVTATPHASHDLLIYQSLQSDFYAEVADMCELMGIDLAKVHEEIGGGFMEACISAHTGMTPADQAVLLKNFLRVLVMRRGQTLSYMPRWSEDADSQSCHIHVSLMNREAKPVFYDASDPNGMSETFRHFVGGLQAHLPGLMLVFAPTVNGWRRFAEGTFAPPAFTWGVENRTTCFRVVGEGAGARRVENRLPCSDTNPHLIVAATLAAGLAGIADRIEPTAPTIGNGYVPGAGEGAPLHAGMAEAIEAFEASDCARDWLGPRFVETFSATRRQQLAQFEGKTLVDERRRFFELG